MKPYYEDEAVTLWHGDCREVLAWLEADVLVTDPPYGIDWGIPARRGRREILPIANDVDTQARDEILVRWGCTRPAAVFGSPLLPQPAKAKQVLVWEKTLDSGLLGTVAGFRRNWEAIYLIGDWRQRPANRSSILRSFSSTTHNARNKGHAHSKPVDLMECLVAASEGVVSDPFVGSGSTLVAAKRLGRRVRGRARGTLLRDSRQTSRPGRPRLRGGLMKRCGWCLTGRPCRFPGWCESSTQAGQTGREYAIIMERVDKARIRPADSNPASLVLPEERS